MTISQSSSGASEPSYFSLEWLEKDAESGKISSPEEFVVRALLACKTERNPQRTSIDAIKSITYGVRSTAVCENKLEQKQLQNSADSSHVAPIASSAACTFPENVTQRAFPFVVDSISRGHLEQGAHTLTDRTQALFQRIWAPEHAICHDVPKTEHAPCADSALKSLAAWAQGSNRDHVEVLNEHRLSQLEALCVELLAGRVLPWELAEALQWPPSYLVTLMDQSPSLFPLAALLPSFHKMAWLCTREASSEHLRMLQLCDEFPEAWKLWVPLLSPEECIQALSHVDQTGVMLLEAPQKSVQPLLATLLQRCTHESIEALLPQNISLPSVVVKELLRRGGDALGSMSEVLKSHIVRTLLLSAERQDVWTTKELVTGLSLEITDASGSGRSVTGLQLALEQWNASCSIRLWKRIAAELSGSDCAALTAVLDQQETLLRSSLTISAHNDQRMRVTVFMGALYWRVINPLLSDWVAAGWNPAAADPRQLFTQWLAADILTSPDVLHCLIELPLQPEDRLGLFRNLLRMCQERFLLEEVLDTWRVQDFVALGQKAPACAHFLLLESLRSSELAFERACRIYYSSKASVPALTEDQVGELAVACLSTPGEGLWQPFQSVMEPILRSHSTSEGLYKQVYKWGIALLSDDDLLCWIQAGEHKMLESDWRTITLGQLIRHPERLWHMLGTMGESALFDRLSHRQWRQVKSDFSMDMLAPDSFNGAIQQLLTGSEGPQWSRHPGLKEACAVMAGYGNLDQQQLTPAKQSQFCAMAQLALHLTLFEMLAQQGVPYDADSIHWIGKIIQQVLCMRHPYARARLIPYLAHVLTQPMRLKDCIDLMANGTAESLLPVAVVLVAQDFKSQAIPAWINSKKVRGDHEKIHAILDAMLCLIDASQCDPYWGEAILRKLLRPSENGETAAYRFKEMQQAQLLVQLRAPEVVAMQPSTEWEQVVTERAVELFGSIADAKHMFELMETWRRPSFPAQLAGFLCRIGEGLGDLRQMLATVVDGSYRAFRYQADRSAHLALMGQHPELLEQWMRERSWSCQQLGVQGVADSWTTVCTDDPQDMLLLGEEVENSCHALQSGWAAVCLMGYALDGKNKLLAIHDDSGAIAARSILRLLVLQSSDPKEGEDLAQWGLLLEKTYYGRTGKSKKTLLREAIRQGAVQTAAALGVPLYYGEMHRVTPLWMPEEFKPPQEAACLRSLETIASYEYFDGFAQILNKGAELTVPIDNLVTPSDLVSSTTSV